jgi:hypothetical protein
MVWWKWVYIGISVGVSVTADGVGWENGDSVIVDGLKDMMERNLLEIQSVTRMGRKSTG